MVKKTVAAVAACFVVLVASVMMFGCYEKIDVLVNDQLAQQTHGIVVDYLYNQSNLDTTVYVLADQLKNENTKMTAESALTIQGTAEFQRQAAQVFDEYYSLYWQNHIKAESDLHYWVMDETNSKMIYNDLALNNNDLNQLKNQYQAAIEVIFDEEGHVAVKTISSKEESAMEYYSWTHLFDQNRKQEIESYIRRDAQETLSEDTNNQASETNSVKLNRIENMRFIFAIPNELDKTGNVYYSTYVMARREMQSAAVFCAAVISLIVFVAALFFSIRTVSEWRWFKSLSKIKFELLIAIWFFVWMGSFFGGIELCVLTLSEDLYELILHFRFERYLNEISVLLNCFVWGLNFFFIAFAAWIIRYVFHVGLIAYIKTHTVLFWIIDGFSSLIRKCGSLIDRMVKFDFEDSIHQIVLRIVGVNFLVMSACCLFFVAGNGVAIVYSVILFIYLKKKLKEIQNDYLLLLDALKKVANGNFNFTIEQDLGIFNSQRDALAKLKDGFEKAVGEEVKSQRMKTELISNVSHDLKTPLTSIISYVDLLKKEEITEEERKEYIDTIDRNSQRLKNLISDLFDISKANSGNVSLHLQEVELISLINQVLFECQEKIEAAGLNFKINCSKDKILLKLDSSKTYRIFENLIINITKYALPGTRVYLDMVEDERKVSVIIKNISASEITIDAGEITERFVQGDKSRNTEGSGLGLAIVKSFTQLQNGEFHVEVDGDLFKAIVEFNK